MPSTKLTNRILLGSIAFGVSFILGLFANRDFKKALLSGLITVPATYLGIAIADNRRTKQEKLLINSLHNQIEELEEEGIQLYQSLSEATRTRQEVEASIHALQVERTQLLNRVSELHYQRNNLYEEIGEFYKQKHQQQSEFHTLQTQIEQFETQQADLSQALATKIAQIQQTENRYNRLQVELEQLHNQLLDKQNQQEQLNQGLAILERQKQNLGGEVYDLQTQIQVLEQRQEELDQSLLLLQVQQQQIQISLTSGEAKLQQLQRQILDKQNQQERLNQNLASLEARKQQLETNSDTLQSQYQAIDMQKASLTKASITPVENESKIFKILPEQWLEWLKFIQHLTESEQLAIKAILEQDEATLKQIANKKLTMPQVIINSINNKVLEQFDDVLFFSSSTSSLPEINEEYFPVFREPVTIYFKDLLDVPNKASIQIRTVRDKAEKLAAKLEVIIPSNTQRWRCIYTLEHSANSVLISSDKKTLISGGRDGKIKLWNLRTGEFLKVFSGHGSSVESIAIASDNQILVSGSNDSTIKLWNLKTGEIIHTFTGHSSSVNAVAISPDSKTLASGSHDQSIKLWDVRKKKLIRTLQGVSSLVSSITFSPRTHQKILTAGLVEGRILQWDLEKDSWPSTLLWNTQKLASLDISPDCKTLVIGDEGGGIKVVKVDMGVEISPFSSNQGSVLSIAVSPDGKTFLSAGNDIRLWALESRELLEMFLEHSAKVCAVAFSPSGDKFVSSSQDGTIKIWQCD